MKKILDWLDGKKTYIIAISVGVVAGLQYLGVDIPEYVYLILAALGLGYLRKGVKKAEI